MERDRKLAQEQAPERGRTRARRCATGWRRPDRLEQDQAFKLDHVPEGGYAVEDPTDGKLRCLEVDRPDEPGSEEWPGWCFVKVRASDGAASSAHDLGMAPTRARRLPWWLCWPPWTKTR